MEKQSAVTAGSVSEVLANAPQNWQKWGPDDEVGSLNLLDVDEVLAAVSQVRSGKVFTLQLPMARPEGDPVWPGMRESARRFAITDKSDYRAGRASVAPGGVEFADDYLQCFLQGSTQVDALAHAWMNDVCWNGKSADTTIGALGFASVAPLARRGVVGTGVLLDFPRFFGRESLASDEAIMLEDLLACAEHQNVDISPRDILILRTGWLPRYYRMSHEEFYKDYEEPGLGYSPELVEWFQRLEIPVLITDNLGGEVTFDPATGFIGTLHAALMRNLGVVFTEAVDLEALAEHCASDGRYKFLYVAAPLNVQGGSGAPVNPVVIK